MSLPHLESLSVWGYNDSQDWTNPLASLLHWECKTWPQTSVWHCCSHSWKQSPSFFATSSSPAESRPHHPVTTAQISTVAFLVLPWPSLLPFTKTNVMIIKWIPDQIFCPKILHDIPLSSRFFSLSIPPLIHMTACPWNYLWVMKSKFHIIFPCHTRY